MRARFVLALAALLAPAAASAAERSYAIGSFERLRVDGPFEVRVETGRSPGAHAEAGARYLDRLDVRVEGDTLIVRMGHEGWGESPVGAADAAPVVTVSTPMLRSAAANSGARIAIDRMKAQRIELAVNGAGAVALDAADADQLDATVIGAGAMTLGGRAARARLLTNGPGTIDASALGVSDLTVRLDGTGETRAQARYTAQVTNTGLGKVIVAGNAACTVNKGAVGPVECGPKL